jgi:hypothetical protein
VRSLSGWRDARKGGAIADRGVSFQFEIARLRMEGAARMAPTVATGLSNANQNQERLIKQHSEKICALPSEQFADSIAY